jgi:hypothetical protein
MGSREQKCAAYGYTSVNSTSWSTARQAQSFTGDGPNVTSCCAEMRLAQEWYFAVMVAGRCISFPTYSYDSHVGSIYPFSTAILSCRAVVPEGFRSALYFCAEPIMDSSRAKHINPRSSYELLGRRAGDTRLPENNPGSGKPAKGNLCDLSEIAAVAFSFLCGGAALGAVFVDKNAAYLGEWNQLIVIGALLTLMNLCTEKLATITFLQLEARTTSLLQNYDIILKKSFLGSIANVRKGSLVWVGLLSISLGLPLVLSISYKTFKGGAVSVSVDSQGGQYGLSGPIGFEGFASGASLMVNATIPFASSKIEFPLTSPRAFGFNLLVLGDDFGSVAMLDAPSPDYVASMRRDMSLDEERIIGADVNGLVWRPDPEVEENRENNAWWDGMFELADDDARPKVEVQYKSRYELATLWPQGQADKFFLYTAERQKSAKGKPEVTRRAFQTGASGFVSERRSCHAQWSITVGTMALVNGSCGGAIQSAYPSECVHLHMNDASYVLADFSEGYTNSDPAPATQTHFTAIVASLFWSRMVAYCGVTKTLPNITAEELPQIRYGVTDSATRRVRVLRQNGALAFIIVLHPLLALTLLIVRMSNFSVPVAGDFGLVSILAGYLPSSDDILCGAGLSGTTKEGVRLVIRKDRDTDYGPGHVRLRYEIEESHSRKKHSTATLRRRVKYL